MASARTDYEAFLRSLHESLEGGAADVRRLANLILRHFDDIARTGTANSQRSILLTRLCREQLSDTAATMPEVFQAYQGDIVSWTRLKHITVGPFRGFRAPEAFDLQKRILLFYGPNGSGKTSLCEAFELALLGTVQEAEARRIDRNIYFQNIHEGRYVNPVLTALTSDNQEVTVVANEDIHRFCFVDKNRIDAFSRIAARTPAQKAELIAALFGMDAFNDFVRGFNESMDGQLKLVGAIQAQLDQSRQILAADAQVVASQETTRQALSNEETALATELHEGLSFEQLRAHIGSSESPSRLAELDALIDQPLPTLIEVRKEDLQRLNTEMEQNADRLREIDQSLGLRRSELSFKDLYTAILELQEVSPDKCPACDTPLSGDLHVSHDPYDKAKGGLVVLGELAELQDLRNGIESALLAGSDELRTITERLFNQIGGPPEMFSPQLSRINEALQKERSGWWTTLRGKDDKAGQSGWDQLINMAAMSEAHDARTREAENQRGELIRERDRLRDFQVRMVALNTKRGEFESRLANSCARIDDFERTNAVLIEAAANEQREVERDHQIKIAYDTFLRRIREYRDALPGSLLAGLNDSTRILYNSFNPTDPPGDLLAGLRLPIDATGRIEVAFASEPTLYMDALQLLSEGHIRCLGLAILLAKNLAMGSPLLLFDDAVNAIDHDHRSGIRQTLFGGEHFAQKQLLVTCHSPEFIKDIQNSLPRPTLDHCMSYVFRPHGGNRHPQIQRNVPSRNYIEVALRELDELNPRAALAASRQALEALTSKIWKWLDKHGMGELTLRIGGFGADPSLRNLCEAIRARLNVGTFTAEEKPALLEALNTVLGIPIDNLVWRYLNKGTHEEEDREDFDAAVVGQVVQVLSGLDSIQLRGPRREERDE